MDITIREATERDFEAVSALFEEIDRLHRDALPRVYRKPGGPGRSREYLASLIEDGNVLFAVAEGEAGIVGLIVARLREAAAIPILAPRRYVEIDTLVVQQGHRRRGAGRRLCERVEEWSRARGAADVELTVWAFNRGAVDFYEAMGYETARLRLRKPLDGRDRSRGAHRH